MSAIGHSLRNAAEGRHVETIRSLLSDGRTITEQWLSEAVREAASNGHVNRLEELLNTRTRSILETTGDLPIARASGFAQAQIQSMLQRAHIRFEDPKDSPYKMHVLLSSMKENPKGFLEELCQRQQLPIAFIYIPEEEGQRVPVDLGGVSKEVYVTLFSSLYEKHALLLNQENGMPFIESSNESSNTHIYRLLGQFYSMLKRINQDRSEPFLTGVIFSPLFFGVLKLVAMYSGVTLQQKVIAYLLQKQFATVYLSCFQYLHTLYLLELAEKESEETRLESEVTRLESEVTKLMELSLFLDQQKGTSQRAEKTFSLIILDNYLKPIIALFNGATKEWQNYIKTTHLDENELSTSIQGMPHSTQAIIDALEVSNPENLEVFNNQVGWLKEVIRTAKDDWLVQFIFYITGQKTLAPGVKIKLKPSWKDAFECHTCTNSLDLPVTINTQELFVGIITSIVQEVTYNIA